MPQPIPPWWCEAVIDALESYDLHRIEWTNPALKGWHDDTFGCLPSDAYDPIIEALSTQGTTGNQTTNYPDQKAAYEFLFRHRLANSRRPKLMYGKIALKNDGVRILILSAHNAKRSSL